MRLLSPAFKPNDLIPSQYSLEGGNLSPPLIFQDIPQPTQTLALIMNDPDAPAGDWTHWLVWNLEAHTPGMEEGDVPLYAVQGLNDFGHHHYDGPHPPAGIHRYLFTLYALDMTLDLSNFTKKPALLSIITPHRLDSAILMGQYRRF